jgi:hypothetical protein
MSLKYKLTTILMGVAAITFLGGVAEGDWFWIMSGIWLQTIAWLTVANWRARE